MAKYETTKKTINNRGGIILKSGYCSLWYLLRDLDPFAYSAGSMGWACDYYALGGGVILATGYNTSSLNGSRVDFDLEDEYNEKARAIEGYSPEAKQARADLLAEFIEKATK